MLYEHALNPILLHLGPLRIGWYGLMYLAAFLSGILYVRRRALRGEGAVAAEAVMDLSTWMILGVILGGRLGWILFYGGASYWMQPWRVLEIWKGGMSFHGGLLGVAVAWWWFARTRGIHPLALSDTVMPWIPMGLFFGRIGNFINGELYGKPTSGSWGVIFPADALRLPRHPTQLYEAVLEGLLLFALLHVWSRRAPPQGALTAGFLLGYGAMRILVETLRIPDGQVSELWTLLSLGLLRCPSGGGPCYLLWGTLTLGQLLSLPMLLLGGVWLLVLWRRSQHA